jgi:hypothetical protein
MISTPYPMVRHNLYENKFDAFSPSMVPSVPDPRNTASMTPILHHPQVTRP